MYELTFDFTRKEASVSSYKQGNKLSEFMRHVQATQQITWQSHHRNPGRKVRFTSSLLLLTIKMDCTLPTDCPSALVYADLLVGSLSTPPLPLPSAIPPPPPALFRMRSLQILVLGGKMPRCESSLRVILSWRKGII